MNENQWNNPKLILSDIDGTFIYDDATISKKTINKLQDLINCDSSYHFGLITGRACLHALYLYEQIGLHNVGFLIGNNGTQILNALTKEVIEEHILDPVITSKIYSKLMEITNHNHKMQIFVNYNQQPLVYIYNIPQTFWKVYNFGNVLQQHDKFNPNGILLFTMFNADEDVKTIEDFIKPFHVSTLSEDGAIAIWAYGISKQTAILSLLNKYHIRNQNVCVFGDAINDKSMFEIPHVYSVTYTHAKEYLQKIASKVIAEPKSDFVAQGIDCFVKHLAKKEDNHE